MSFYRSERGCSREFIAFGVAAVAFILLILQLSGSFAPASSESWEGGFLPSASLAPSNQQPKLRYAYATFLTGGTNDYESDEDDLYYISTRMLVYQLLHAPASRTQKSIPVVVAVTEEVAQHKRERLREDGATVLEVAKIDSNWIHPAARRWRDMMTKLRIFQWTQFDRVLFLDSDMFVARCIDGIFEDGAAARHPNLHDMDAVAADEATQPATYVMASNSGSGGVQHSYPAFKNDFLNGGFFLFHPSTVMFDYYLSVANISGRFDDRFAEQSLLNYAHRRDGNMPWQQVHYSWNINWPNMRDYREGIATFHTKFWDDKSNPPELYDILQQAKREMEEYWERQS